MAIEHWKPSRAFTKHEQFLLKHVRRTRKLFAFLREYRHEIFDDEFQSELGSMYRDTGAGDPPVAPAMMAMATLLQGYTSASDAEAVVLTVVDLRWQMVLDRLGSEEPAFSQGAFYEFRQRLIRTDMDRRLLERTAEIARTSKAFDAKKLPKSLRVGIDSSPIEGAGRVEDTINLIGHAARNVMTCAATLLGWPEERLCREAGIPVLLGSSVKAALDREWSDPNQKAEAIKVLVAQVASLNAWLREHLAEELTKPPLEQELKVLEQVLGQDLEPDPTPEGGVRIRQGVAEDRRVSIQDSEMRHGRKSKTKRFNGYKRHIAADLDSDLILACAITPANRPEEEATPDLKVDLGRQKLVIDELYIDRAYINSGLVDHVQDTDGEIFCKPWFARNGALFTKQDFKINMRDLTITCPAGETERFQPGSVVEFDPEVCAHCPLRAQCTMAAPETGRSIKIAENERLQHRLRKRIATRNGRAVLRRRVGIEHRLAHISQRQGRRARYCGTRKNLFDLRRAASIQNLETLQRANANLETLQKANAN
jgi:hypothetical protein